MIRGLDYSMYVYMQMFLSIMIFIVAIMNVFFYHSCLFFYLRFVGGLETFLKNLSIVWDIFRVGFSASCSAPSFMFILLP